MIENYTTWKQFYASKFNNVPYNINTDAKISAAAMWNPAIKQTWCKAFCIISTSIQIWAQLNAALCRYQQKNANQTCNLQLSEPTGKFTHKSLVKQPTHSASFDFFCAAMFVLAQTSDPLRHHKISFGKVSFSNNQKITSSSTGCDEGSEDFL